jgi:hypothetical protein
LVSVRLIGDDAKTFYYCTDQNRHPIVPMTKKVDRIVLAVADLSSSIQEYQRFFGIAPYAAEPSGESVSAWWGLPNTVIQLVQSVDEKPRVQALVFSAADAKPTQQPLANALGLDLRLCDGSATEKFRRLIPDAQTNCFTADHIVLRTDDARSCINLFEGELKLRLALDKTVPQWGGRMLFFRVGKMTLEVIESVSGSSSGSGFWGLAYQCQCLESTVAALAERGVTVSDIREGRKPGTLVATVKSHCLNIPTLLIQPAK